MNCSRGEVGGDCDDANDFDGKSQVRFHDLGEHDEAWGNRQAWHAVMVANFCSSDGGWLPLICTMNVTSATTGVHELFGLELDDFGEHIASVPVGAEGVLMLLIFNSEPVPARVTAYEAVYARYRQALAERHAIPA